MLLKRKNCLALKEVSNSINVSPQRDNLIKLTHNNKTKTRILELDVSPGKIEAKQGKFDEFISPTKGYFREN